MGLQIDDGVAETIERHMQLDVPRDAVIRRILRGLQTQMQDGVRPPSPVSPRTGTVVAGRMSDLVNASLVSPHDALRFTEARWRLGHSARLDEMENVQTQKGTYSSPSTALGDLFGYSINGWKAWIRVPSGDTLSAVRDGLGS